MTFLFELIESYFLVIEFFFGLHNGQAKLCGETGIEWQNFGLQIKKRIFFFEDIPSDKSGMDTGYHTGNSEIKSFASYLLAS